MLPLMPPDAVPLPVEIEGIPPPLPPPPLLPPPPPPPLPPPFPLGLTSPVSPVSPSSPEAASSELELELEAAAGSASSPSTQFPEASMCEPAGQSPGAQALFSASQCSLEEQSSGPENGFWVT